MSKDKTDLKKKAYLIKDGLLDLAEQFVFAFSHHNYMDFMEYKDMQHRKIAKENQKWLRELKHRKWIETKTMGERILGRLTEQGWQQALRHKIRTETNKCKNGVCIVIFDIPEKERFVRNALRKFLKEWGFQKLQHSVWMTERDIIKPMMLLLQRRGLDKWIRIIQGSLLTSSSLDHIRAHTSRIHK